MSSFRLCLFALVSLVASTVFAGDRVPFRARWSGSTVSAAVVGPNVVFVVSAGGGTGAHLGRFEMVSPHYSFMDTLRVEGTQHFTAANGDRVDAEVSGQLAPAVNGCLGGALDATITGGTGRFAGAAGAYVFDILACPGPFGFNSTAAIDGWISSPGH